jgi:hypothetical protein
MAGGIAAQIDKGWLTVEQARAQIGSAPIALETWTKSAAEVRDWAATAQAGDTFVYAKERHLSRSSTGAEAVRALIAGGYATANVRAVGNGISEYIVRRIKPSKRVSIGHDRRAPTGPKYDGDMSRMLRVLRLLAREQKPCPANRDLAKLARLGNGDQASYALKKLVKAEAIAVEIVRASTGERIVTLVDSGEKTAAPL